MMTNAPISNAAARQIRIGAERLRKIAASEADPDRRAEMTRIAQDMDEHAAELERSIARGQSQNAQEESA